MLISIILISAGVQWGDAAPKQRAKHVVLIGLDGWGAYSVHKADMPALASLMEQGSYTLKKRTVLPSSSAPNWASMFMGIRRHIDHRRSSRRQTASGLDRTSGHISIQIIKKKSA